jgi:hypothetical protein
MKRLETPCRTGVLAMTAGPGDGLGFDSAQKPGAWPVVRWRRLARCPVAPALAARCTASLRPPYWFTDVTQSEADNRAIKAS